MESACFGVSPQELTSELEAVQKLNVDQGFLITDIQSKNGGLRHEVKRQQSAAGAARNSVRCVLIRLFEGPACHE